MEDILKVSLIQTDIIWENPEANFENYQKTINTKTENPDLIILPEMFNSGFSMHYSEGLNGESSQWLKNTSKAINAHIYASLAIEIGGKKYNQGQWASPNGDISIYNKKHLFSYGSEHRHFSSGNEKIITNIRNWKFKPLICYDLRFPVWSRNTEPFYDILIYIASWPMARIDAWKTLLKARAIENQCYVIGVNRLGKDGNNLEYNGQSMIFDFSGKKLLDAENQNGIFSAQLSYLDLHNYRIKFPFLSDGDSFDFL
ncbi:nitrilase family protein [Lacihabitans sp. LS3-19]|uniref:nitrilase-related carbon-nitrogen hydrolase n=1 Tax=Lacihabitans sp. LS3-19 TaxID=2487335 RepID=UPI0020CD2789|nr:nitrilase-related carbon-nitrogen hydrolase [Lacihabitans sp. LS3-19]MCP9769180.1 nitrilase family protein [Lacihabitans sp. LS3-19]